MSEYIEKARKLLSNLAAYPNAYVTKEKTNLATQAQAYATLALVETVDGLAGQLALGAVQELARSASEQQHENRCPSCDHLAGAHSPDGCVYEVRNTDHHWLGVCPCVTTEEGLSE